MASTDMHTAKRRRVAQATSVLTRPFRSPLRPDVNTQSPTMEKHDQLQQPQQPQRVQTSRELPGTPSSNCNDAKLLPLVSNRATTSPIKLGTSQTTSLSVKTQSKSAASKPLQRQCTRLINSISKLRGELDIMNQAIKLETSNEDTQLEFLVEQWRSIARAAADELIVIAKDQIDREGGFRLWRKRTEQKCPPWEADQSYHIGSPKKSCEEPLENEQREQSQILREEADNDDVLLAGIAAPNQDSEQDERDDESFTMDMMLRQLNVDLDLVGYDIKNQQWLD